MRVGLVGFSSASIRLSNYLRSTINFPDAINSTATLLTNEFNSIRTKNEMHRTMLKTMLYATKWRVSKFAVLPSSGRPTPEMLLESHGMKYEHENEYRRSDSDGSGRY